MKNIDIILNDTCNFKCVFCEQQNFSCVPTNSETQKLIKLFKVFKSSGFESITFSGGEPTLDSNLSEYIKTAKVLGFKKIKLQTNLSLISINDIDNYINLGLTHIGTTFFGNNKKAFFEITGIEDKDFFDNYFQNLKYIGLNNNLFFDVDFVLNEEIINNLKNNISFIISSGANHINFKYPFKMGNINLSTDVDNYSKKLYECLIDKDFSYNVMYIPLCKFKDKNVIGYDYKNDYIYDGSIFSLESSIIKLYEKNGKCINCSHSKYCFGFEK